MAAARARSASARASGSASGSSSTCLTNLLLHGVATVGGADATREPSTGAAAKEPPGDGAHGKSARGGANGEPRGRGANGEPPGWGADGESPGGAAGDRRVRARRGGVGDRDGLSRRIAPGEKGEAGRGLRRHALRGAGDASVEALSAPALRLGLPRCCCGRIPKWLPSNAWLGAGDAGAGGKWADEATDKVLTGVTSGEGLGEGGWVKYAMGSSSMVSSDRLIAIGWCGTVW